MFEVEIDGKKVKGEVSFYTAQLYEAEFKTDLIQDFFGVVDDGAALSMEDGHVLRIDFTKTNWLATAKVLWAAVKTADEYAPNYTKWMKGAKGANLWLVSDILSAEIADCFFRAEAPEKGAPEGEQ